MPKLYYTGVLVVVSQLMSIWIFGSSLWHFYDHAQWLQALNALGLSLCLINLARMSWLTYTIRRDHKADMARLAALEARVRTFPRHVVGPDELEEYIQNIERLDPAMGADLRKNLREFLNK